MLSLFRKFMPREDRFFDLFEQHSRTVVGAAEALRSALAGGPDLQKHCDRIVEALKKLGHQVKRVGG